MPLLGTRGSGSCRGFGFGAGGAQTIEYISHSTASHSAATSITINKPTSVSSGNLLVAFICHPDTNYTQRFTTLPSGWTLGSLTPISTNQTGSLLAYYKVAGGSEPASYTWSGAGTSRSGSGIILNYFAEWDTCTRSWKEQTFSAAYSLNVDPTSITVGEDNSVLFFAAAAEDPGVTIPAPSGYSTRESQIGGSSLSGATWLFYKNEVSAGSSGTPATTVTTNGQTYALLAAINPK